MSGLARKYPVTLFIIAILLSVILFSSSTEGMLLPDGAAGFQHTASPDSTLFNAFDNIVEFSTTTALTSPQLYQRVQNATDARFLPAGDWSDYEKPQQEELQFELDQMSESYEDCGQPKLPTSTSPTGSDTHRLSELSSFDYVDPDSEFHQYLESLQRENELAATQSESWNDWSIPSNPNDGSLSPHRHIYSASPSPSETGAQPQDKQEEPNVSPIETCAEFPNPKATGPTVTSTHLTGPFNFGDRFDPDLGWRKVEEITKLAFETESSPSQPHLYPANIPFEAFAIDDPQSFPTLADKFVSNVHPVPPTLPIVGPQPSGKHTYCFQCPEHHITCANKEDTIFHFLHHHEGRVVTPDKPHPCVWDNCNRAFQYPKDLSKHIPSHTKEKNFTCVCNKNYSRMDNLRRHQNGNENSRPCKVFQASLQQGS